MSGSAKETAGSVGTSRTGDAGPRNDSPTKRAALAGIVLAGLALVVVGVAVVWDRPAQVPTYSADAWTGEAVAVATGADAASRGLFTACPTAILSDGGTVAGLLLVEGWGATITAPMGGESRVPVELRAAPGIVIDHDDRSEPPVMGRVLDPAVASDAALADAWTGMCGEVEDVVLVAPDAVVEVPIVVP
ncbi:MAG: hypothetical protein ACLGHM_06350 [Actinomycetes bacterium]